MSHQSPFDQSPELVAKAGALVKSLADAVKTI
jgi:hypothetical protein